MNSNHYKGTVSDKSDYNFIDKGERELMINGLYIKR